MRLHAAAKKRVALAVTMPLLSVLGLGGAALAGRGADIDEVQATLDFARFEGKFRLCVGLDGIYDEGMGTASGISAGDSRLSGRFAMHFQSLDRLTDEGHLGTVSGRFEVFDPDTGRRKVNAEFRLVQRSGEELGLIFGNVADHGTGPGEETTGTGTLTANTRISFVEVNGAFDVIGQIGGTSDATAMPAVIQSGGCTGPYEQFAFDLPTSETEQAAPTTKGANTNPIRQGRSPAGRWARSAALASRPVDRTPTSTNGTNR